MLRRLVSSASALGVVVLLLPGGGASVHAAGSGAESQVLDMELVGKRLPLPTTTTTVAPTTTTIAPTTTTTVAPTTAVVSSAGFETGNFSELQMNQANNGSTAIVTSPVAAGTKAAKVTVNGGVNAQYARVGWSGPFNSGQRVVYQGSFFFPTGFYSTLTNQMDLMRFDNWDDRPTASEQSGLTINLSGTVKKLYLFRNQLGTGGAGITYIAGPYALPTENVWHRIEVRQTLSAINGSASNALYVDGVLQGSSTNANMFGAGNRYNWFRAGIVSSGGTQATPISLHIDGLSLSRQ